MALQYNTNKHYVDDKFSALVEPNLFANNVFQPGVSFTDKYQMGAAGQILVHKPGIATISATTPGADFSHVNVADSLITISLNKQFNRSRKIYGATAAAVQYPIAAAELELAVQEIKQAWNLEAYKALIGTASVLNSDNILTLATASTIYDQIVADRQKMVENKVNPTTILVSPSVYGLLLKSDEFQRTGVIGDNTVANGIVGRIAGMNVIEYQSVDAGAIDAATIGGITWASGDEMEYVMYDVETFSIVSSVNAVRVMDSPDFIGSLAQVEMVSGFKVTNPTKVLLKFHDLSAS